MSKTWATFKQHFKQKACSLWLLNNIIFQCVWEIVMFSNREHEWGFQQQNINQGFWKPLTWIPVCFVLAISPSICAYKGYASFTWYVDYVIVLRLCKKRAFVVFNFKQKHDHIDCLAKFFFLSVIFLPGNYHHPYTYTNQNKKAAPCPIVVLPHVGP